MNIRTAIIGIVCLGCVGVHADDGRADKASAEAAFARLKTLVGRWEGKTDTGKVGLVYELVAGGTALLERETADERPEMVTLFHLDGDRLLLTHYCMAGNQPRMELRSFNASTGELQFAFVDATNLANPAAGHMRNVTMRVVDPNQITAEWVFYENGKPEMTERVRYTRVR